MGADIYLESVSRKCEAKHRSAFDAAVAERDRFREDANKAAESGDETLAARLTAKADKLQERVDIAFDALQSEGYFRDSYNRSSLLWLLGLSWWGDVMERLDENGHLPVESAKWFLAELEKREVPSVDGVRSVFEADSLFSDWENEDRTPDEWRDYFVEKRDKLIALVKQSIELDEPLLCSV